MCPSEVSDIEHSIWRKYGGDVVVWGISSTREGAQALTTFAEQHGITYPILEDTDGSVHDQYAQELAFVTAAYPQDWVIGVDGTVVYMNNSFELEGMVTAIEGELD